MNHLPFERVMVLFNPASTHAAAAKKRIDELRRLVDEGKFLLLQTSERGRESNRQLLLDHADLLGPETLLCVAAGDGTINMTIEALACCANDKAKQTILLPLWGGNANDVAHMLNGPAYRMPVSALLQRGKVVEFRPLSCLLTPADGASSEHLAVGYISFGATALAARRLNEPPHRSSRLHKMPGGRVIQEFLTVFQALLKAPSFRIDDGKGEQFIYDRMFINGSRIAKLRPLPLRLTDQSYYETTASEKRLKAVVARLRELLRRPAVQRAPQIRHFTCLDDAWAQFDGETIKVPAGTKVTVRHGDISLRAWSVRLNSSSG